MSGSATFVSASFARPPAQPVDISGTFGEAWEHDAARDVWTCGDHMLGVDEQDWTRWQLAVRATVYNLPAMAGTAVVVAGGQTPPLGYRLSETVDEDSILHHDLTTCPYVVENDLDVPTEGLDGFLAYAQEMLEFAGDPVNAHPSIGRTYAELLAETPPEIDWLVPGLLAPGWALKIAAREKEGKGTLIHYLLAKLERGEETVFGPSRPATALYVTEEPTEAIREKAELFGVSRSTVIFGHDLLGMSWPQQVDYIIRRAIDDGHKIIVLDNFSRRAGVEKEEGTELSLRLAEIADPCKAHGLALVIDHHHRKSGGDVRDRSRGGTSFAGAADVNVEMVRTPENDDATRKRALTAIGRMRASRWQKVIELTEDGRDYAVTKDGAPERSDVDEDRREADLLSVLASLSFSGPATAKEMAERLSFSVKKTERLLKMAHVRGQATRDRPASNMAFVYSATGRT